MGCAPEKSDAAQLTLVDPYDDGLSWHEWFTSLPLNPSEVEPAAEEAA